MEGVAISTDGSVTTQTLMDESEVEQEAGGDIAGVSETGEEAAESGGMGTIASIVLCAIIVFLIGAVVVRYRKQKKAKEAFFRRMEGEDNDNLLGGGDDDWDE